MLAVNIYSIVLLMFALTMRALDSLLYLQKEKNITNHFSNDRHPSFSPDGKKIVFESDRSGKWSVYIMNTDGSNQQPMVTDSFNNRIPSFYPDGKLILFESDRSGFAELYTYDVGTTRLTKVFSKEQFAFNQLFGACSSDGNYLAFCSDSLKASGLLNIFLFERKSGKIQALTKDTSRSLYPAWSPDSKEIIFFSRLDTKGTNDELYQMNISTRKTKRLTNYPLHDFCPVWSRKRNFIVYVKSMETIRPELYKMNLKTKKETRITFNNDGDTEPAISPDGKKQAWTGFRNGNFEICVMNIN